MSKVEAEIEKRLRLYQDEVARLCTIPGVDKVTAWGLLSEIGLNSPGQLGGDVPGQFRKRRQAPQWQTRKGSAVLRRHLCQAGWAVSTKRDSYLSALFRRLAARRG